MCYFAIITLLQRVSVGNGCIQMKKARLFGGKE